MLVLKEKKDNMKKNSASKGLLLDWLLNALDKKLYKRLYWDNIGKKIFCIVWTHKSAEQWTNADDELFIAWAEFKGKRNGKNSKQLKATFRCALNSKKDHLRELPRGKDRRYWQFIDPASKENESNTKKTRKVKNEREADISCAANSSDSVEKTYFKTSPTLGISSNSEEYSALPKLPNFKSFCSFASLTPPHQANEIPFSLSESVLSQQKSNTENIYTSKCNLLDRLTPNVLERNSPSVGSNGAECRTICTPSPDRNNLTPPLKDFRSTSPFSTFHHSSTDIWQPNGWTTSLSRQDLNNVNQLLSNDFDELYISTVHETNHNRIGTVEMDQFVPVMDIAQNIHPVNGNEQYNCSNETVFENDVPDQKAVDDHENGENFLNSDLDPETWNIMQELDKFLHKSTQSLNQKMDYSSYN